MFSRELQARGWAYSDYLSAIVQHLSYHHANASIRSIRGSRLENVCPVAETASLIHVHAAKELPSSISVTSNNSISERISRDLLISITIRFYLLYRILHILTVITHYILFAIASAHSVLHVLFYSWSYCLWPRVRMFIHRGRREPRSAHTYFSLSNLRCFSLYSTCTSAYIERFRSSSRPCFSTS